MSTTKLIVGLGNIGREYENTRHNVGFLAIEDYAAREGVDWHEKPKFKAFIAEKTVGSTKVILAKPTTFMNLSGEAVRAIKDFYKLENDDVIIIHDELDLPFGTIRTRIGGSSAGNNGIKSISSHIGDTYARIRIGIGNELLPRIGAHDFVLSRFSHEEMTALRHALFATAHEQIAAFVAEKFQGSTFTH